MRTDQWIGLNNRGWEHLERFTVPKEFRMQINWHLKDGTVQQEDSDWQTFHAIPPMYIMEEQNVTGAWSNSAGILHSYSNGLEYAKEVIQAEPWSSGPMYFVALQNAAGEWIEETLWTEEEMEGY